VCSKLCFFFFGLIRDPEDGGDMFFFLKGCLIFKGLISVTSHVCENLNSYVGSIKLFPKHYTFSIFKTGQ
jgi:hypothetical protein